MKLIKEAFAEPSRELSCNITIGETVYNDDFIEKFKIVKGLSEAKEFEVGTAFMSSINLKMVDKLGEFNKAAFKDKTCKVEIGVKTSQGVGFVKVGEYFIDSVGSDKASWTLKGYDKMCKFNVKYDCKLDFPTTLKSVVLDICKMCGVEPSSGIKSSTGVLNKTIKYKPNFYEMTCREVLAQVAELCCGWAYIDTETQKLEICSGYSSDSDIKINDDNLIVFKELKSSTNSDTKIQIDSVKIIQKGADDADYNANSPRKFHIIDNIWIQGNGHEFLDYATKSYNFSELSALSIKYNGNPALENNKFVAVNRAGKIYRFLPLVRRLTYNGGLVEECECPQINYDPTNRRKDLVRHIEKISATLRVMDEKIQAKVGTEEFATLVEQTKEEIKALAKSINLTGYVKFEDLKKVNGTTEINGGNITTGVIQSRDGGFGIDLDNKTFFLGRDLEHYALLFDGRNLKFGAGGIKSEHFSEGLKQELKGKDGQSQYVHTRYSDTGGTTGAIFIEPSSEFGEPHKYIGFAITSNKGAPALKSAYTWSKYIGEDGSKGSPGEPGTDGKTPYFHIAWADNSSGSSGFTTSGGTNKPYMGTYTDFTESDSIDPGRYKWVKVKGDDGESFKYNLISNGDFHIDVTKAEAGYKSSELNRWQFKNDSDKSKAYIKKPSGKSWVGLEVNATDTLEINQYLDLKKNTKYYIKATIASEEMKLYYNGLHYSNITSIKDNYDDFTTINMSFTTHDSNTHFIQLDCRKKTTVRDVIISEEPISDNTEWYPSKFDGIGQDGKDGKAGPQGPPGPPGEKGAPGTLADLPEWVKEWNGTSTTINGKYVITPQAYIGESERGIFIGKDCVRDSNGQSYSGIVGYNRPDITFNIKPNGTLFIGKDPNNRIEVDHYGALKVPKIKTSDIVGDGKLNLDSGGSAKIAVKSGVVYLSSGEGSVITGGNRIVLNSKNGNMIFTAEGSNNCITCSTIKPLASKDSSVFLGFSESGLDAREFRTRNSGYHSDDLLYTNSSYGFFADDTLIRCSAVRASKGGFVNLACRSFDNVSDLKIKENISFVTKKDVILKENKDFIPSKLEDKDILDFVKNIRLATFNYKGSKRSSFSMIAQDVNLYKGVRDYLITENNQDENDKSNRYLAINQVNYHSCLHRAFQLHLEDFEKEKENNARLEERVRILETEISEIKKLLKKEGE